MSKRGPGPSEQTLKIVAELRAEKEAREHGNGTLGFRNRLAKKYGLSRQRITQLAQAYGIDDDKA